MNNNHYGGYINQKSPMHAADTRLKLLLFIGAIVLALLSKGGVMYLVDFALAFVFAILSKLKINQLFSFIKRLWLLLVLIFLMNFVFFAGGDALASFWIFKPSMAGLYQGAKIVCNVVLILMWAQIILATTPPMALMQGIDFYLAPLRLFKIKTDNLTLIISVAIQFIPILSQEADTIKKAQIARGAGFESKNLFKKAGAIIPLVIPIFVAAFKRADELSQAMEARGYQGSEAVEK